MVGGGGGEGNWVNFCCVNAADLSEPIPHYSLFSVYSVANYRPHLPILVTFGQICNFRDPSLVTFYFYELIHSLV